MKTSYRSNDTTCERHLDDDDDDGEIDDDDEHLK